MSHLHEMLTIIKGLLLENELSNIFDELTVGDMMFVHFNNSKKDYNRYEVIEVRDDKSLMLRDVDSPDIIFRLPKNGISDNKLSAFQVIDGKERSITSPIDDISFQLRSRNNKMVNISDYKNEPESQGQNQPESQVEPESQPGEKEVPQITSELKRSVQNQIDDINETISNLKPNDVLAIEIKVPKEGSSQIEENFEKETIIYFNINEVNDRLVLLDCISIDGDDESSYHQMLFNKNVSMSPTESLFTSDTYELNLKISVDGNYQTLANIFDISKNESPEGEPVESRKALGDKIKNDKEFKAIFLKKPSLMDVFFNATPKGLAQLDKMVSQTKLDNAYLTVGNKVEFKLLTTSLSGNPNHEKGKIEKGKAYETRVVKDKTLRIGKRDQVHWDITLKEALEENQYRAEITFYKGQNMPIKTFKNAIIQIQDITK